MRVSLLSVLPAALLLGACCGAGAFDHEMRFDLGVDPVEGPPNVRVDVYALREGDTISAMAQVWETYFGDNGCRPEGPLGPGSRVAPDRYDWSSSDPAVARVDAQGRIQALGVGEAVVSVEGQGATGSIRIRVVPYFTALRVTPAEAEVAVGDTVGFTVEALGPGGETVPGVNFRTAGVVFVQPFETWSVAANTTYSLLDGDPVHFVYQGLAPGVVPLTARTRVAGVEDVTAEATLVVR